MAAKKKALLVFAIATIVASSPAFASIPRSTVLDPPAAIDHFAFDDRQTSTDNARLMRAALDRALPASEPIAGLAETRVRAFDVLARFERQPEPGLSRALRQACELRSVTGAYGSSFAGGDPVNRRDPSGEAAAHTGNGGVYISDPKSGARYLVSAERARENPLALQDARQNEGALTAQEAKDFLQEMGLHYTHPYDRPVIQSALPKGNNWGMNALIATSGLPPQNRQQEIVQGGIQIAGTAVMVVGGTYGNAGTVSAQPAFETSAGMQVGVNDFMAQNERLTPTVRVYRVEGPANARVTIGPNGEVTISDGQEMQFYNFGNPIRAQQFFAKRLGQKMFGVSTKSFEVPRWFMLQLEQEAVSERAERRVPGAPLVADETKAPNQYGLRPSHVDRLRGVIVPGSGNDQ